MRGGGALTVKIMFPRSYKPIQTQKQSDIINEQKSTSSGKAELFFSIFFIVVAWSLICYLIGYTIGQRDLVSEFKKYHILQYENQSQIIIKREYV